MQGKKKRNALTHNLLQLLRNLEFSDIRVQNNSEFPEPYVIHSTVKEDSNYRPALSAYKHGVTYYFEVINSNLLDPDKIIYSLQEIFELRSKKWNIDLVLVTNYGNKAFLEKMCQDISLVSPQIWEF